MLKRLLIVAFVLMLVFPLIDSWFLSPSCGNRKSWEMATVTNLRTVFFFSRPARPGENGSSFRNGVNLNEKGGGSRWDSWG